MRRDYARFVALGAEVVVLGPDGPAAFQRLWRDEGAPFVGLSDAGSRVADQYQQEVNLLKLGRMPAVLVIDRDGRVRYSHYGNSMADIPENEELLALLERLA